jgi:hypothetical protein
VIGIGWGLGEPEHNWNAFLLLLLNVAALNVLGSASILAISLAISGIRSRHLDLEKSIRSIVAGMLKAVPNFISNGSSVDVTLLGGRKAIVDVHMRCRQGSSIPSTLAEQMGRRIAATTSFQADVAVEVISMLSHTGIHR